jgi:hypothetical protein
MTGAGDVADVPYIAAWYSRFAASTVPDQSPLYREWARAVADDVELLTLLSTLERPKRQPHLVFAVSRLLGAPEEGFDAWRAWMIAHWDDVQREASVRTTQTNEPGRLAALLPLLAGIEGPLALLEVGASAGLCLYPDRYSYEYEVAGNGGVDGGELGGMPGSIHRIDPADGPSTVVLRSTVTGPAPLPTSLPQVVWRAGIDLEPLDVADAEDVRWLEMLVGPEQHDRRARIRAAVEIVREDLPLLVRGDVTEQLAALAAQAPSDATLVVIASGVLVYLRAAERAAFAEAVTALGCQWVSLEDAAVFPSMVPTLEAHPAPADGLFVLGLDGNAVAWCGPHGQSLAWHKSADLGLPQGGPAEMSDDGENDTAPKAEGKPATSTEPTAEASTDGLSERDRKILEFERRWWRHAGAKEEAIRAEFGLPAARYYQLLNAVMDVPGALRFDPMLVKRLQRARSERARARSARAFRSSGQDGEHRRPTSSESND